jgi:hypothetical protein
MREEMKYFVVEFEDGSNVAYRGTHVPALGAAAKFCAAEVALYGNIKAIDVVCFEEVKSGYDVSNVDSWPVFTPTEGESTSFYVSVQAFAPGSAGWEDGMEIETAAAVLLFIMPKQVFDESGDYLFESFLENENIEQIEATLEGLGWGYEGGEGYVWQGRYDDITDFENIIQERIQELLSLEFVEVSKEFSQVAFKEMSYIFA